METASVDASCKSMSGEARLGSCMPVDTGRPVAAGKVTLEGGSDGIELGKKVSGTKEGMGGMGQ